MADDTPVRKSKGIKVKVLARELGITSRALIDRLRSEGVFVQNSITKLNRAAETRARALFSQESGSTPPGRP